MYASQVGDQKLTLRVSGKLWMRSLIMSDVETGTEWSHLLGRAMAGELKDQELKPIVSDMATWKAWVARHPETTVLDMPRTSRHYDRDFYKDPNRFVFGFIFQGKPNAISLSVLEEHPVLAFSIDGNSLVATFDEEGMVARLFDASIDGKSLTFRSGINGEMKDQETGSLWNSGTGRSFSGPMKGKQLSQEVGIMSYRKAWDNFHPRSNEITP